MRYSDYKDFPDFCRKNQMTPEQGLNFLMNEVINGKEKCKNGTGNNKPVSG